MAEPDDKLDGEALVRRLWRLFDEGRFEDARSLLADDFVAEWPGTREIIRGPANFIALNRAYPGSWRCRVLDVTRAEGQIISEVAISDGERTVYAVSFFTISNDKIRAAKEYFADATDAPFERSEWVERY